MKRNVDREFDRQVHDKFKNFTPEVSTNLWSKIEEQLAREAPRKVVPMVKKRGGLSTWWMAVAATLLIACGVAYWYQRPTEVTFLYGKAKTEEAEVVIPTVADLPAEIPEVALEPIDRERWKQLFTKKEPKVSKTIPTPLEEESTEEAAMKADEPMRWVATDEKQPEKPLAGQQTEANMAMDAATVLDEALAKVPDVQPLVVFDEDEETMLASVVDSKQSFGLSNILNYVVGTVDQREEKLVTFSNDSEGSLKLDFNFGLAKNRKKKIK